MLNPFPNTSMMVAGQYPEPHDGIVVLVGPCVGLVGLGVGLCDGPCDGVVPPVVLRQSPHRVCMQAQPGKWKQPCQKVVGI